MTSEDDDSAPGLSPAESLALVDRQSARVRASTGVRVELLYAAWGVAWLLGFGAIWATASSASPVRLPGPVAGVVLTVLMVGAMVTTVVHTGHQVRGLRSPDTLRGTLYGWSWTVSFIGLWAVLLLLDREGVEQEVLDVLWPAGSALLVAALYLAGSAVWRDVHMFALGGWIVACVVAGVAAGVPTMFAVMSLAGGSGFLVAAAWFAVRAGRLGRRG